MPIQMRNPFRKTPGDQVANENAHSANRHDPSKNDPNLRAAKPLDARPNGSRQPVEYKLSEINDSGVFLPPSPTERPNFWSTRSQTSTNSSRSHRSVFNENEPFNMSRESFDSYRRSFDISARSPVTQSSKSFDRPRQSLDARRLRLPPSVVSQNQRSPPLNDGNFNPPDESSEESFEDVGLDNDGANSSANKVNRKPGFLSRFGGHSADGHGSENSGSGSRPTSSGHFGSGFFGKRTRGGSGQGEELGNFQKREDCREQDESTAVKGQKE